MARAREDLDLAKRRRDALVDFGRPLELSQARSDAQSSRETLRQLESAASYRMSPEAGGDLRRAEPHPGGGRPGSSSRSSSSRAARCGRRCPGIVVYKEVFFGSEQRKPQVGDQVWANQPLIILPDISRMVVETKVRETDIHKVERNQKVGVRVEAYPDLRLTGAVTLVGTLAQEEKERRGAKFFSVTVQVNESEPRLRPGHDRAGRDRGGGAGEGALRARSRRSSSARAAPSSTSPGAARARARSCSAPRARTSW